MRQKMVKNLCLILILTTLA